MKKFRVQSVFHESDFKSDLQVIWFRPEIKRWYGWETITRSVYREYGYCEGIIRDYCAVRNIKYPDGYVICM